MKVAGALFPVLAETFHSPQGCGRELIKRLGTRPVFVAGISFGGVIALRHAIAHSDTIAGLVPMSSFAEVPSQLLMFGTDPWANCTTRDYGPLTDFVMIENTTPRAPELSAHE
jgi:pimeloyl-ACP methyl ester carboxylesterase